jgi:hypothetical protein
MPEYFVYKRQGPYGIKTLSQLEQNGEVDNNAFVWTPGMASLEYAKKMPELRPWFEEQELESKKVKVDVAPYAEAKTIPAPQPAALPQLYKVAVNSQSTGPFSLEQLLGKIQAKEILPQTLVWRPGLTQWIPAQDVADFSEAFAAVSRETLVSQEVGVGSLQSRAQTSTAGTAEGSQVPEEAESQQREDLSRPEADEEPKEIRPTEVSEDYAPPEITLNGDTTPEEPVGLAQEEPSGAPESPVSLLQESDDDRLPLKKLFLPAALILLGGVLAFLALKTAVLAELLAILASLLAKLPIAGGRFTEEALFVKLIPGGLFVLAGVVVLVVTVLSRRSSELSEPAQL